MRLSPLNVSGVKRHRHMMKGIVPTANFDATRERLRRRSSPLTDGGTSERRARNMMKQRGSDEWKRGAIHSRTESEKLHVRVKEKEERGAGVGIAATIQDYVCCSVDGVSCVNSLIVYMITGWTLLNVYARGTMSVEDGPDIPSLFGYQRVP